MINKRTILMRTFVVAVSVILALPQSTVAIGSLSPDDFEANDITNYHPGSKINCLSPSGVGGDLGNVPDPWRSLILQTAPGYPNADARLVAATLWIENRGWPDFDKVWAVSPAGAQGPWQFIPSTWALMGHDGDGDGVKDPNNPKDAVHSAFKHQEGSAGKVLVEGFDNDLQKGLNLTFSRVRDNLLAFMAAYNGSGAPSGVAIKDLPRNENSDYVYMAYYVLASNFTQSYDRKNSKVIDMLSSGEGSSETSSSGAVSSGCSSGGVGKVDATGHSFPVGLEKSVVSNGISWPCDGACHHDDSPAMDLAHKDTVSGIGEKDSASVGVPVYAIKDAEIKHVQRNYASVQGCFGVNILSDDGWNYWYGHISDVNMNVGETIAAGQQLGVIGQRDCTGNGSYPHLHIDRGYPKGTSGGVAGSRDSDFITLMNTLYEGL